MANIVQLDVGGTVFKTTESTLTKFDGFFRTMFETGIPITKDESGAIFIDRSSKHFDLILNFMRDGDVDLPNVPEDVKEIQKEAEYYMLKGLVELCKKYQKPVELEYPYNFRYIISDEELMNKTYKPEKPILIIFGPVRKWGSIKFPENVDLLEIHKKYASRIDIYIRLFPYSDEFYQWRYEGCANGSLLFSETIYKCTSTKNVEEWIQKMISTEN